MASYNDQLRQRLAQISENSEALTTWEQLSRQRNKQRQASLAAIAGINSQQSAYQQQLANLAEMYSSRPPATLPSTAKKKKKSPKPKGSLGDSIGSIGDVIGGIL